jgi:flagellar basal body P-ring protein FlgI
VGKSAKVSIQHLCLHTFEAEKSNMSYRSILPVVIFGAMLAGCAPVEPEQPTAAPVIPGKEVAEELKGTIWEQVDVAGTEPLRVSGFGLVVNLSGTGDTRAPNPVREYMIKQMQKHGFGNLNLPGFGGMGPERVLNDPLNRTAIVRVDGFIPPGALKNELFDVQVTALENSNTTSLHRGILYTTDLSPRGADPFNPGAAAIATWARVSGPVFVNPTVALDESPEVSASQRLGLRTGVVMGRGINLEDRPLVLKLRNPDRRIARLIEKRIQEKFQSSRIASMQSEGDIFVYMPAEYGGDWERFAGVVTHLFLNPSNDFAVLKARKLVEIAQAEREKAPLLNFTYCWEAMGPVVLPEIRGLYNHDSDDVAYAAARAGAFLGDGPAEQALAMIARQREDAYQLAAVRVLGQLPRSARVSELLRELIDSDQLLLRIEAYRAMLASGDSMVYSQSIRERFILDIVPSKGPPIIYASRLGKPRIALIGQTVRVANPALYLAMRNRLSIASQPDKEGIHVFFRGNDFEPEAQLRMPGELSLLIATLGGEGPRLDNGGRFDFGYGDVVGILQHLADRKLLVPADAPAGQQLAQVVFEMQTLPGLEDPIMTAPPIMTGDDEQRPTTRPAPVGRARTDATTDASDARPIR